MIKRKLFAEGRILWQEYININGYSFEPSAKGIAKLSKSTGQKPNYIRERINVFLEA